MKQFTITSNSGFNPLVGNIPWRRKWQPTPVFLPGEFYGERSLAGHSPWSSKELDMTERLTLSLSLLIEEHFLMVIKTQENNYFTVH